MGRPEATTSAATEPSRSARLAAAYAAARLYFEEGLSQADVAERLSVSRSTVSRLLAEARGSGIVRIEIRPPLHEAGLGDELAAALGLRRVVVVPDGDHATARMGLVDAALRELAALRLGSGDVLLVGWGRATWDIANGPVPPLTGVEIVPAVGGMDETQRPFQSNEIVRRLAEAGGATPHLLHAPALPGARLRRALLGDERIEQLVSLWDRIDAAIVGIGVPPGLEGSFSPAHVIANVTEPALGRAAGDIVTRYFDLQGRPVRYPAEDGLLAVSREQLERAGTVIGVAAGVNKHRAIVGAARAGLIGVLVTDTATAKAALELAGATG